METNDARFWRGGLVSTGDFYEYLKDIKEHFQQQGIDLDWVLYSTWDALVDAFVRGEIDLAWNGPLEVRLKSPAVTR